MRLTLNLTVGWTVTIFIDTLKGNIINAADPNTIKIKRVDKCQMKNGVSKVNTIGEN